MITLIGPSGVTIEAPEDGWVECGPEDEIPEQAPYEPDEEPDAGLGDYW